MHAMRSRGGRISTRGRGRGSERPSAHDMIFSGMLETLPEGRGLETPLTIKRKRQLPTPAVSTPSVSESPWYLECGGSGASTPRASLAGSSKPVSGESGTSTPRATPAVSRKRVSQLQDSESVAKRSLIPSSSSSSTLGRPLREDEISSILNYGSEEDSDDGDDEDSEELPQVIMIPRVTRPYLVLGQNVDEDPDISVDTFISYSWPPAPAALISSPLPPSSHPHPSPSPRPTSPLPSTSSHPPLLPPSPRPTSPLSSTSTHPPPLPPSPRPTSPLPSTLSHPPPLPPSPRPTSPIPLVSSVSHSIGATSFNLDKFDFVWEAFPQTQVPPELRREPFSNMNCGPTIPLASPYEAFTAIWDHQIMEHIAIETNAYAQQVALSMLLEGTICPSSRITKWIETNAEELYVYFALVLAMGVVVKSRLEEYWSTSQDIFTTPGFSASMSINRFRLLSKCIHFNNNENFDLTILSRPEAKLYKLKPIIEHLNNKFSSLYVLSRNIALDESLTMCLTMWKGWLDINQFIRNKAASIGIKTYEVCESHTGYLWRFQVHAGHENENLGPDENNPISGVVPSIVLKLLNGLENRGHSVFMDNYYNSPALARELKVRGFDCVGTLRTDRQFVPLELTNLKKSDMAVGEVCGCTTGDVDLLVWRHKNRVAFVSTYHGLAAMMCDDTLKPTVVADYNICMGGVDRKDQMLSMYPIERKRTRIWYKKLFRRLLNVSVLNAYIMYRHTHAKEHTHRTFRQDLIRELIKRHTKKLMPAIPSPSIGHFPAQFGIISGPQGEGTKREHARKTCVECKKRTNAYCMECNVPLCVFTCFKSYHSKL